MNNCEELKILIDLYKFYLELIVQSGILAGAIIGSMLGYLIKQQESIMKLRKIPLCISAVFVVIYGISIYPSIELSGSIYSIGKKLNLIQVPHSWLLPTIVILFFIVFVVTSIFIFYWPNFIMQKKVINQEK